MCGPIEYEYAYLRMGPWIEVAIVSNGACIFGIGHCQKIWMGPLISWGEYADVKDSDHYEIWGIRLKHSQNYMGSWLVA